MKTNKDTQDPKPIKSTHAFAVRCVEASGFERKRSDVAFTRGFALAISELSRNHGAAPSGIKEALRDAGYCSIQEFVGAGVDPYDIKEIAKHFPTPAKPARLRPSRKHSRDGTIRCNVCSPLRCSKAR